MECLTRLIGIWDGCGERDPSLLYINDIEGFDLSVPEYLAKEQDSDPLDLIKKIRAKSSLLLKNEFLTFLDPKVEIGSVLYNGVSGIIDDNKRLKSAQAGKYAGVQIEIPNYPYAEIFIQEIGWFTQNAVSTNVLVFDLTRGQQIDTIPITTVAGDVTYITVNKTYQNKSQYLNLAFVVDAGLTGVYEVNTSASSCKSCFPKMVPLSVYTNGRGVIFNQTPNPVNNTMQGLSHTNGIIVRYSLQCDHEHFLCQISNRLMLSMYYRFGIELMGEIINSPRLNSLTTVRKDNAVNLRNEYTEKYKVSMENVMKNLQLPNNACYHCTPLITNKIWI